MTDHPLIAPNDAEYLVRDYLQAGHASRGLQAPVDTKDSAGTKFTTLYLTGTAEATTVSDRPRLTFNCYGPTEYQAFELARLDLALAKALDSRVLGGVQFYEVEVVGGLANFPNPRHPDLHRYQFTCQFHLRSQVL